MPVLRDPAPAPNGGRLLTVASLNLHSGRDAAGRPFDVTGACARLAADVIALQEVPGPESGSTAAAVAARHLNYQLHELQLSDLVDPASGAWVSAAAPQRGFWGLALLVRPPWRLVTVRTAPLGTAPRDPQRQAQLAEIAYGGQRLQLVHAHVTHRLPANWGQLRRLVRLVPPTAPTLLLGDFNTPALLARRVLPGRSAVRGATWPARRALLQLDHIALNGGLAAVGSGERLRVGSDHRAVRAVVRLSTTAVDAATARRCPMSTDAG